MVEGFWKTRDNEGKAAWLFIGVLSSVYWISDVITDDELAVLIICACSSRNLFIKHHLFEQCLRLGVMSTSGLFASSRLIALCIPQL